MTIVNTTRSSSYSSTCLPACTTSSPVINCPCCWCSRCSPWSNARWLETITNYMNMTCPSQASSATISNQRAVILCSPCVSPKAYHLAWLPLTRLAGRQSVGRAANSCREITKTSPRAFWERNPVSLILIAPVQLLASGWWCVVAALTWTQVLMVGWLSASECIFSLEDAQWLLFF